MVLQWSYGISLCVCCGRPWYSYHFTPEILILTHQQQTAFENIVGKEGIAHNEQFLLFPQCFLLSQRIVSPFVNIYDIIFLFAAELEEPKFGLCGKGLYQCDYRTYFVG